MVESAVSSTANLLGKILVEEGKYLWGAEDKVKELQEELLWMRSFLRKADSVQYEDDVVWAWVCQVQKYVYEAEDVIDKFVIKVVSSRSQIGWQNKLKRYSCILKELYNLHQAASSIDSLKVKISTLSPKLEKYGLMRSFGVSKDRVEELRTEQLEQIHRNVHLETRKITGLDANTKEIIAALKTDTPGKGFHAIYGMGGCGKTTLATKVWQDKEVGQHFSGGQAFSYVSKQFKVENVLRDVLRSLCPKTSIDEISASELNSKLGEALMKKCCLVVLDDVWTKQAWDSLKTAFNSCGGDSGSKLLLTTRKKEVAEYVDSKALQKPDPLEDPADFQLFQESMGQDLKESLTCGHNHYQENKPVDNCIVFEKKELVKKMLKVCKGLPLAIVVLGGILRKKQSVTEWKSVLNNISSHLVTGYDHGKSCMEILLQSYDDLPYHLKPCFLHLAIFPEDYEIKTQELYWMWVGEGLVTMSARGDVGRSKSMEDVANDYLRDLAEVSLVQVMKTSEGWIESIRLHDIVRDVCIEKASADNLFKSFDFRHDQPQIGTSSSFDKYYYNDKVLVRAAVAYSKTSDCSLIQDCIISNVTRFKCIRSLIFILDGWDGIYGDPKQLMICICREYQVLRVLVLKDLGFGLIGRLSSKIGKLVHLRYFSLRGTRVSEVPSSIGKLRFLEILDLQVQDYGLIIPNTLWELFRLRHLLLPGKYYYVKGDGRLRVHTLICLESIQNLQLSNLQLEDLSKLKNLRDLSIKDVVSKDLGNYILSLLETSSLLQSLIADVVEGNVLSEHPEMLSCIVWKGKLHISGEIILPRDISFSLPPYLTSVSLYGCELKDDPMGILGSMPHLETLELGSGCYSGTNMSCSSSSFPLLVRLKIYGLKKLKVWEAYNGFMPKLENLEISTCEELSRIPDMFPTSLSHFEMRRINDGCMAENIEIGSQIVRPYDSGKLVNDVVLHNQDKTIVVILGNAGAGKSTYVMKHLVCSKDVRTNFDVVASTWVPRRRKRLSLSPCLLPRCNIEQLLRDLNSSIGKEELNRMSREELTTEIQLVMRERKCLVILLNLELEVHVNLEADLEKMFGHRHPGFAERGSKLVITSPYQLSDHDAPMSTLIPVDYHLVKMCPSTPLQTWKNIKSTYWYLSPSLRWNWMRHHSSNPLLTAMFVKLEIFMEIATEWTSEEKKLIYCVGGDRYIMGNSLDLSQVFEMRYYSLPLYLRRCLVYLASFPDGIPVSANKLHQMCVAYGFYEAGQHLVECWQETVSDYFGELVNVEKRRRVGTAKTYQLKSGLRDLCLANAKKEPWGIYSVHLDQMSENPGAYLDAELRFVEYNTCPTSLLIFSDISSPLCSEDNWEWMLYICNRFRHLLVLDVQGMWMTKGSLPVEVGYLMNLRYLSLRATWVTKLPSSLENLLYLQTLDLRVMETLVVPDVLWKLKCLMHLYLPQEFAPHQTSKLQLSGLSLLQTLVNLDTDKVILKDLPELESLNRLLVTKIHARDEDELSNILVQLSTSLPFLELCIASRIINADQTILARKFNHLKKLKIKGTISIDLKPEIFPSELEEMTLKHSRLEEDPLAALEKLPKLRRLVLDHESFLGKEVKFSGDFLERASLRLCSLCNLETLYTPKSREEALKRITIVDCWKVTVREEEKMEMLSPPPPPPNSRFLFTNWRLTVREEERVVSL